MNPPMNSIFKNKHSVIFDFDGTIADTFHLHETAFRESLKDHPVKFAYKDYAGMSTREAMRQIFAENEVLISEDEFDFLIKQKQRLANQLYKKSIEFIPGAFSFIHLLHIKGFKLSIASSGSRKNVLTGLETLKIENYFSCIITSEDVPAAKPDPAIFRFALKQAAVKAQQAIVIEDALSGIQAAIAAGIDVVCIDKKITEELFSISFPVKDFFELSKLLIDGNNWE